MSDHLWCLFQSWRIHLVIIFVRKCTFVWILSVGQLILWLLWWFCVLYTTQISLLQYNYTGMYVYKLKWMLWINVADISIIMMYFISFHNCTCMFKRLSILDLWCHISSNICYHVSSSLYCTYACMCRYIFLMFSNLCIPGVCQVRAVWAFCVISENQRWFLLIGNYPSHSSCCVHFEQLTCCCNA